MNAQMLLSAFSASAVIADMNGDGLKDVVKNTGLQTPQHVSVSYNRRARRRALRPLPGGSTNSSPYFVSVGDLNNDNRLDLVVTDDS